MDTRRLRISVLALLSAGSLCAPLAARAAVDPCRFSNVLTIKTPSKTFYIDDRADRPPQLGATHGNGTWLYMDSNGVEGLQRGGKSVVLGDLDADTCVDPAVKNGLAPDDMIE